MLGRLEAGDPEALGRRTVNRLIAASPALQARDQRAIATSTDALADQDPTGLPAARR